MATRMQETEEDEDGKRMLSHALMVAKTAVVLDSENKLASALEAYEYACRLLSTVVQDKHCMDAPKLQQIHDTYAARIALLKQLTPAIRTPEHRSRDSSERYSESSHATLPLIRLSTLPSSSGSVQMADSEAPTSPVNHSPTLPNMPPDNATTDHGTTRYRRPSSGQTGIRQSGQSPRMHDLKSPRLGMHRRTTEPADVPSVVAANYNGMRTQHSLSMSGETSPRRRPPADRLKDFAQAPRSPTFRPDEVQHGIRRKVSNTSTVARLPVTDANWSPPSTQVDSLLRPYFLFVQLRQTLASTSSPRAGIRLTPVLYVSGDVWLQKGCKIKAEEEKLQAYDGVVKSLRALCLVEEATSSTIMAGLAQLELALFAARTLLAKRLGERFEGCLRYRQQDNSRAPTRKMSSASKGITKFLTRRTTSTSNFQTISASSFASEAGSEAHTVAGADNFEGYHRQYQAMLAQLFDLSQVLARLNEMMDLDQMQVKDQLRFEQFMRHAADFFGNVVIKLYLNDIGSLLTHKLTQKQSI